MNRFIDFYQNIKPQIQKEIHKFNQQLKKEKKLSIKESIDVFCQLNEAGKMIRGTLIILGYSFHNDDINYALPLACAYEVFETSILVHDDIIDNDDLRRGIKTINAFNKEKYHQFKDEHLANSIAICLGDLGLYKANDIIINNYGDDKVFAKLFKQYNDIVINTIRGETLDVIMPFEEKHHLFKDDIEKSVMDIYTLKTAWYSIVGPLILGMILAKMDDNKIKDVTNFALPLGIAFQIQDDLLGIYAQTDNIGKQVGSDIKEFKQTILYAYTKKTPYYNDLLKEYGNPHYDIKKVQSIFEECGAKDYALKETNKLYNKSLKVLNKIDWLQEEHKLILIDLINYLKERKK